MAGKAAGNASNENSNYGIPKLIKKTRTRPGSPKINNYLSPTAPPKELIFEELMNELKNANLNNLKKSTKDTNILLKKYFVDKRMTFNHKKVKVIKPSNIHFVGTEKFLNNYPSRINYTELSKYRKISVKMRNLVVLP